MNRFRMKSALLVAGLLMMGATAHAQYLRTSYFMEGASTRLQMNPGLQPTKGYFNLPILGSLSLGASSNVLGTSDIIDVLDAGDDLFNNDKLYNRLKSDNRLNVNLNTDILSFGWYRGQGFWNVNVGLRADVGASIPKSMFEYLRGLNNFNEVNGRFSNMNFDMNAYAEIGLGYSRQLTDRLTVGGRVKVLLGMGNLNLKFNSVSLDASLPSDARIQELQNMSSISPSDVESLRREIDGYHADLMLDARLESSFKGLTLQESSDGYIDDIKFESGDLGIAGYGFGIDLGASYRLLDHLTVSAAVLDLGFISWSKGSTQVATAASSGISLRGSDYTTGLDASDPMGSVAALRENMNRLQADAENYMNRVSGGDVLDYELLELRTEDVSESRRSRLASTIVAGAEYGFFNDVLSVGVLSTTRFVEPKALTELTLSANYRPKNWFNLAVSYSAIQSLGKSFGVGLKLGSLFLGTDYMFLGKNSNSINAFIGISVPIGQKKRDCCCL